MARQRTNRTLEVGAATTVKVVNASMYGESRKLGKLVGSIDIPHPTKTREQLLAEVFPADQKLEASDDFARKMPEQRPGKSRQDYATPADFIRAVEARFGPIVFDLAADADNTKAPAFYDAETDALKQDWSSIRPKGNRWLNPPFGDIRPWAQRCELYKLPLSEGKKIIMLTPASVGTEWFNDHVHDVARVYFLRGRISFDGKDPYPKDLMLSVFGEPVGYETWRWGDFSNAAKE